MYMQQSRQAAEAVEGNREAARADSSRAGAYLARWGFGPRWLAAPATSPERTLPADAAPGSSGERPGRGHRFRPADCEVASVPLVVLSIGMVIVVMVAALRHEPEALVASASRAEAVAELRTPTQWPEPRVDDVAEVLTPESTGVSDADSHQLDNATP